jgi:hypothetical protein
MALTEKQRALILKVLTSTAQKSDLVTEVSEKQHENPEGGSSGSQDSS